MASGSIVLRCAANTAGEIASCDPVSLQARFAKRSSRLGRRDRCNAAEAAVGGVLAQGPAKRSRASAYMGTAWSRAGLRSATKSIAASGAAGDCFAGMMRKPYAANLMRTPRCCFHTASHCSLRV